jgi:D-3-phosphoglycerate dehydrogenase / 2-oxoglutarate reductase
MGQKLKIVVTDFIESDLNWEAQEMAQRGHEFRTHQLKQASTAEVVAATADADVVVVNMVKITPEVIAGWKKCRLVIRHGAGYDNIDIKALTARGIVCEYIPDYCTHEVAEQAVALMYACARKIVWSRKVLDESVVRGEWDFAPIQPMYRLAGSTVGIVGCGRIGSLVLHKLSGLDVKFLVCDPYLPRQRQQELGVKALPLKEVCQGSDYVTLHPPLNDETRGLMNKESIAWMKPTAYLINTARGGVVDVDDLAAALKKGTIAGAGIDVFTKEPPRHDYPLLNLPNVVLTPHLSWYSKDAEKSIREKIVQDIDLFAAGSPPRIAVNPEALEVAKR